MFQQSCRTRECNLTQDSSINNFIKFKVFSLKTRKENHTTISYQVSN